jgi:hypothetical protein
MPRTVYDLQFAVPGHSVSTASGNLPDDKKLDSAIDRNLQIDKLFDSVTGRILQFDGKYVYIPCGKKADPYGDDRCSMKNSTEEAKRNDPAVN